MTFNTGDRFTIYKVLVALDQAGSGQRDALRRDANNNPVSAAWPNQTRDPVYSWNNRWEPQSQNQPMNVHNWPGAATVLENRDYYNNTPKSGYTPYTYPHPLTKASAKPGQPSNKD
jgi:hypothetical protein